MLRNLTLLLASEFEFQMRQMSISISLRLEQEWEHWRLSHRDEWRTTKSIVCHCQGIGLFGCYFLVTFMLAEFTIISFEALLLV